MADFGTSTNFRPVLPETGLVSGRAINLTVSGPQTLWLGCDLSINLPTDALPVGSNLSVRGGTRSLAPVLLARQRAVGRAIEIESSVRPRHAVEIVLRYDEAVVARLGVRPSQLVVVASDGESLRELRAPSRSRDAGDRCSDIVLLNAAALLGRLPV